ncbi:hypothetical protein MSG28_000425 [Choristoneura fumiferana]|uniref:Uncharacterized protein n=1 Tax=Choristoneura fumiferana TaxID=7141 RepID=A0ACC0K1B2_CHOFU|nr:hypothetical protein MSG28_000425 [Choristoneura fumiferana]
MANYVDVLPLNKKSRKRRPSSSCDLGYGERDEQMNECNAALVLMSLSCSPNSPRPNGWGGRSSVSPGGSSSSGSSWRSVTPSPPPVSSSFSDEGIAMDYEDTSPRKKRATRAQAAGPRAAVLPAAGQELAVGELAHKIPITIYTKPK